MEPTNGDGRQRNVGADNNHDDDDDDDDKKIK